MNTAHALPRPQHRNRRYPVSLWAIERSGDATYHHLVSNLSLTGMFLQKSVPIPVGTSFRVELALPTGRTVRGLGTVVHATATDEQAGLGVRLSSLLSDDRNALQDYLENVPVA